jgi:hypothetical protein
MIARHEHRPPRPVQNPFDVEQLTSTGGYPDCGVALPVDIAVSIGDAVLSFDRLSIALRYSPPSSLPLIPLLPWPIEEPSAAQF